MPPDPSRLQKLSAPAVMYNNCLNKHEAGVDLMLGQSYRRWTSNSSTSFNKSKKSEKNSESGLVQAPARIFFLCVFFLFFFLNVGGWGLANPIFSRI